MLGRKKCTMWDVVPLRAIVFQFLFLLLAIAIEGLIFYRILNLEHKVSMQYAATVNLLSTLVGWLVFFSVQSSLPSDLRLQLLSYVFYERFLLNSLSANLLSTLVMSFLFTYLATAVLELWSLKRLEIFLGKVDPQTDIKELEKPGRFRRRQNQAIGPRVNSKFFAVFLGNACSFFIILVILGFRLFTQSHYSTL